MNLAVSHQQDQAIAQHQFLAQNLEYMNTFKVCHPKQNSESFSTTCKCRVSFLVSLFNSSEIRIPLWETVLQPRHYNTESYSEIPVLQNRTHKYLDHKSGHSLVFPAFLNCTVTMVKFRGRTSCVSGGWHLTEYILAS